MRHTSFNFGIRVGFIIALVCFWATGTFTAPQAPSTPREDSNKADQLTRVTVPGTITSLDSLPDTPNKANRRVQVYIADDEYMLCHMWTSNPPWHGEQVKVIYSGNPHTATLKALTYNRDLTPEENLTNLQGSTLQ